MAKSVSPKKESDRIASLEARLAAAEARVAQLEARPAAVHYYCGCGCHTYRPISIPSVWGLETNHGSWSITTDTGSLTS